MQDYDFIAKDDSYITDVDDIQSIDTGLNMVLFRPMLVTSEKNGILLDNSWEKLENAQRFGEVVKVPKEMGIKGNGHFSDRNYRALEWDTTMELKEGDVAWVEPLSVTVDDNTSISTIRYRCDGVVYFLIPYDKFIVAKRKEEVVCLNGYVLIEELFVEEKFQEFSKESKTGHGIVRFCGSENKSYHNRPMYSDEIDLKPGYLVKLPEHIFRLEDPKFLEFDGKTDFIIAQRRFIPYTNKKVNMDLKDVNIPAGQLFIEPVKRETKTKAGIILPEQDAREEVLGVVAKMGKLRKGTEFEGLGVGSVAAYSKYTQEVMFNGVIYKKVDMDNLDWWKPVK